jgi:hypothetical protein
VRMDGTNMGQARLFHHATRGAVDCHGCGDNPREILVRESDSNQRARDPEAEPRP